MRNSFLIILIQLKTNRENGSQCSSCRTGITAQPVLSFVLKNQVDAFVEQLSPEEKKRALETLEKEDQKYKQISDNWAGIFDQPIRPWLDSEDGVLRCPTCGWEGMYFFFQRKNSEKI